MVLGILSRKNKTSSRGRRVTASDPSPREHMASAYQPCAYETLDSDPLRRMLQQGRYAAMLREESKYFGNEEAMSLIAEAKHELEPRMALVPAGTVTIPLGIAGDGTDHEEEVSVEPFLLDVHCISNARFQKFVDAGGYDELEFWPEEIWPHLIELKDLTGQPGPRFWRQGRCDARLVDHPVVGISWYEAQAYALWIGQRLPTESEWQMAASWHINSSTDMVRRFPWGDAMDKEKCNIWSSRVGTTSPVNQYPNGSAPNHVLQLVGNVWEWTDSEYAIVDDAGNPIVGEMPMHVIKGGAFDTYFELQATADFRTGQIALARAHNTGFRCAMPLREATWISG